MINMDIGPDKNEVKKQVQKDREEAKKNPVIPGARVIRRESAKQSYDNGTGCIRWTYPFSGVNLEVST